MRAAWRTFVLESFIAAAVKGEEVSHILVTHTHTDHSPATRALKDLVGAPIVGMILIFWFLIIRPQQKKQKQHLSMVDSLRKGDKVVTNGGIFGTIVKVGDDRITLEIASKVQIQIERQQVARMDKKIAESKEDKEEDDDVEKKKVAKKESK